MAFYLMTLYGDPGIAEWFKEAWAATGRRLDMGKCCVRFRKLADVPLDVVGEAIAKVPVEACVAGYERAVKRK